ncbi:hypothetical protein MUK42_34196 [Musa troglodytarum]|uniref:Uncharacterized protein n=1 Tax=Musa troglodytarum TaxID=320322 RepID=A0A9E7KD73_9LILI|nr:hypothetical protein MUK42_34196 [Musa troglodytarum]
MVKSVPFWHDSLIIGESSHSSPTRSRFWLAPVANAWIGTLRSPHWFLSPPFPTCFLGSLSVSVLAPALGFVLRSESEHLMVGDGYFWDGSVDM